MSDGDEDDEYHGLYENGHWEWCSLTDSLVFRSHLQETADGILSPPHLSAIGSMDFRDDLDVIEQQRFRKRFQRKMSNVDVVMLQDVKDLVLYTAPKSVLTTAIVKIMHFSSTDRFLRALISYCQYYIQIAETMSHRILDLQVKVRTQLSDEIEQEFRENLEDLRLLLAKEYCSMILGAGKYSKYHHMGVSRKMRSLSKREAIQFESIVRLSTQIVWLALGRKSYNQIELEINRVFKSDKYNNVEHKLNSKYQDSLTPTERLILFGSCLRHGGMMTVNSPLMDQTTCSTKTYHYQVMGLGQIKYEKLEPRLRYLERLLILPETLITHMGMSIGILGLPRWQFDIMLKPISLSAAKSSLSSVKSQQMQSRSKASQTHKPVSKKSVTESIANKKLYEDIVFPEKEENHVFPDRFPVENQQQNPCNTDQLRKWLAHIMSRKRHKSR